MAAILLVAAAVGVQRVHDKIQEARSPTLPVPAIDGEPPLSYLRLKTLLYDWLDREHALSVIYRALVNARNRGQLYHPFGSVRSIPSVRQARDEARFISRKLIEARDHCKANGAKQKKNKLLKIKEPRQTLDEYPPSLLDLPYPLPRPPPLGSLTPIIDLPPPAGEADDDVAGDESLPTYTKELGAGEKLL